MLWLELFAPGVLNSFLVLTVPLIQKGEKKAGADVLVAGSAVFRGGSVGAPEVYGENIKNIRAAASGTWT